MKKILLFVASILLSQLAMAQPYLKYELGFKSNIPGEFVPNSDDAVIGVERATGNISYLLPNGNYKVEDLHSELFTFPGFITRLINHNNIYSFGNDSPYYSPKLLYNISSSASTNSGRCIVHTYTHKFPTDPSFRIYYKVKESVEDLTDPPPGGGSTHWNAKSNHNITDDLLKVYPNPTKDYIIVQHTNETIQGINIFGIDGKLINLPIEISEYSAIIQTGKLLAGHYVIQTILKNGSVINKAILKN